MTPIQIPLPISSPTRDIDTLWPLCLAIAQRRRHAAAGTSPADAIVTDGIVSHPGQGHALQGAWSADAARLFALFKPLLDLPHDGPEPKSVSGYAIGQLGQSLDGCIATAGGDSSFVNGPDVLVHLHRLRALCDAVVVGAGTAALDNPRLTTRRVAGPNPVRVVIDPGLRVASGAHLFTDDAAPTLLVCSPEREREAQARVGRERVLAVPLQHSATEPPCIDLRALRQALAQRGLRALFIEGGGVTVSRFIAQGQLDRLHLSVAPVVIGGGRLGLQLPPAASMQQALRPAGRLFAMGADALWDLDLTGGAGRQPPLPSA